MKAANIMNGIHTTNAFAELVCRSRSSKLSHDFFRSFLLVPSCLSSLSSSASSSSRTLLQIQNRRISRKRILKSSTSSSFVLRVSISEGDGHRRNIGRERRVSSPSTKTEVVLEEQVEDVDTAINTLKTKQEDLLLSNEEKARQKRIGQMNQRLRKAASREDRISYLEIKSKSTSKTIESNSPILITENERKELNGLYNSRESYEEQYNPEQFNQHHMEFKDMHNDAFIALTIYCENERRRTRKSRSTSRCTNRLINNSDDNDDDDDDTNTAMFYLDGPDGGTTKRILKHDHNIDSSQCYVANRHESSCIALREILPNENVVHATCSEALTKKSLAKTIKKAVKAGSAITTYINAGNDTETDEQQQQQGSFAHIDFCSYYFDGCGGYVPHIINMISSALLQAENTDTETDTDIDTKTSSTKNTKKASRQGPIVIGYSLLGGNKNVIGKELAVNRAITIIGRTLNPKMRLIHVLDDPITYGISPKITKIGGSDDGNASRSSISSKSSDGSNTFTTWVLLQPELIKLD